MRRICIALIVMACGAVIARDLLLELYIRRAQASSNRMPDSIATNLVAYYAMDDEMAAYDRLVKGRTWERDKQALLDMGFRQLTEEPVKADEVVIGSYVETDKETATRKYTTVTSAVYAAEQAVKADAAIDADIMERKFQSLVACINKRHKENPITNAEIKTQITGGGGG